ncbi:hypothetical protein Hanom_Chr16g01467911 [Helianthus anomalus]
MYRNMGRKGKEHAGSSSRPEGNPQQKRRLNPGEDSDLEEEQYLDLADKPVWEAGPLDDQPIEWQPTLFNDHMNWLKDKAAAFICEKEVKEAALNCYDRDNKSLFKDEIQERMATLTCPKYNKPQQMKLIGTVNGIEVEMSFDTLRKLAKYDSLPAGDYMFPSLDNLFHKPEAHPRWNDMLEALILPGTYHGDKQEVRFPRVPILYSLLHGSPRFPFRFLVINNVWICRNKVGSNIVPYCRIITGLLKMFKAITQEDKGQRWRALKVDARALLLGEEDEPESDDEPRSVDDDYADEPNLEHMEVDQWGPSGSHVHGGGFFDYAERSYEPNWAYQGTMQEVIENQRPPTSVFDTWSGSERTFWIIKLGWEQAWSGL